MERIQSQDGGIKDLTYYSLNASLPNSGVAKMVVFRDAMLKCA
jgi:hypothetical protein